MLGEMLMELEPRGKDREAGFWATARQLAAGEKVATPTVERLLAEGGKTPRI